VAVRTFAVHARNDDDDDDDELVLGASDEIRNFQ